MRRKVQETMISMENHFLRFCYDFGSKTCAFLRYSYVFCNNTYVFLWYSGFGTKRIPDDASTPMFSLKFLMLFVPMHMFP